MHRPEGYEFLEVRRNKLAWSMKPDWKSVRFEGVLDPDGQARKGEKVSFSVDLAFGTLAKHMSSEDGTRDLVCDGQMLSSRLLSRFSCATTLG